MNLKLKIGDRVRVKDWDDIPDRLKEDTEGDFAWRRGRAKVCGSVGTIVDTIYSNLNKCFMYRFKADDSTKVSSILYDEECFERLELKCEVFQHYDKVVVRFVDPAKEGTDKYAVCCAYGYIRGNTAADFVQAVSFATNLCYRQLNNNNNNEE